jgi:hypothetical protein
MSRPVDPHVCSQCGGPLLPEATACQWCGARVVAPTRVVVERVNPEDFGLEDDTDGDEERRAYLVLAIFGFAFAAVFLGVAIAADAACSGGGTCVQGAELGGGVAGFIGLLMGIIALGKWYAERPSRGGF